MNRREFIKGILAAAAAAPVAKAVAADSLITVSPTFMYSQEFTWVVGETVRMQSLREALMPGLRQLAMNNESITRQWDKVFEQS